MSAVPESRTSEDLALDAAREAILAVGWSRTTLTDIARRAGLSRMTLYRRWPEMSALLGDLMTREWAGLVDLGGRSANHRERLVDGIVSTVRALRANELFTRIIELDPQMLLPYLLERPGRSQELVLTLTTAEITAGQQAGEIRDGDPRLLARTLLLTAHGFTLSAQTMTGDGLADADFDRELALLVERYLTP
ncbi:TetR/AcrR family transcriptional regulator [Nocardioides marmoriginsengisoli]|uniref:TetR/AcrR family transcriptional regulator n=1 Tax=Nocardioides marmoriginsengisoli TaxID=661483 RepID=A0A3N0CB24_9ACTN|nr:TetR/AcrR family transcriptional regulator [Nocardioides marmoriginsengisoli]RNL60652.1 TetR/AcrR family transcriptional regulator [Nocardioides marmoriginsengisoli]